jgi:hypothetical protein
MLTAKLSYRTTKHDMKLRQLVHQVRQGNIPFTRQHVRGDRLQTLGVRRCNK